jgi:pilus assembly protein CpaB
VVTLLLSPDDSQKLQLASTQGTIQFVLRNGTDSKNLDLHPTRIDQLVASAKPPAPPSPQRTGVQHPRPAAQPTYVLEVIQGTQRTVHKFGEGQTHEGEK